MIKNFLKRVKAQKGMSGVLVALLLVIVGVGLVAGINTFLKTEVDNIQSSATNAVSDAITGATN